ncbi:nucleotide sugar dehydrogenase [Corynebacterium glutamicum Z188]|uniref:UDP-N-acetyl-D-glucosamine dehydrogenase n=1 Tax=Corynebacterium glutamicum TaxID=1718 RepID=A0AB36IAY9_CORGT|nr:nucleotide sugar dehydrogenase [Corynebacterium glutamicum]AGN18024.1 nucleotide sugar dehydrogenase [Corynebacterium glutamicum SCgG1]AGN21047.1 nucleotide sugar dehydrogenase [Corynebacterium glutamicum SCgG2]EGV40950.1 UDP-N-acetyl-D-mannosaminuronic acid dehydrogenase [Corynebacterium glutamicum S9114]EPP41766.1 nucleotide sugar dehydrogenase [Corynebacterium glutamicum Z188]NII88512.1 nucleotide sugar dehydrogenase [Corynebacterium glutamicum]
MKKDKKGKAIVIGQGYVGLPVAVAAAEVGWDVVGIDLDKTKVEMLQNGSSPVEDISDELLQKITEEGRYRASSDYSDAVDFDVAVISVPTPLRETKPDLSYIELSGKDLAPFIKPGAIVILESTTYPGTTEELLAPILEKGSGLKAGQDFYLGYSPERIDPGNTNFGLKETPKVVSGVNSQSLAKVKDFFDGFIVKTVPTTGTREAELAKLVENTFRHVNIALVNELAQFAGQLGIDIWEAIEAASSKPFGFMKFTPGPGVGGHCLPIDPSYLSWQVQTTLGMPFRFVDLANDINNHMPDYVVQRVTDLLNADSKAVNGSKILMAGIAYKSNTGDVREAPALKIIELLQSRGANVVAADPFVVDQNWPNGVEKLSFNKDAIDSADLVILINQHDGFDLNLLEETATAVFDTRNVIKEGKTVTKL